MSRVRPRSMDFGAKDQFVQLLVAEQRGCREACLVAGSRKWRSSGSFEWAAIHRVLCAECRECRLAEGVERVFCSGPET